MPLLLSAVASCDHAEGCNNTTACTFGVAVLRILVLPEGLDRAHTADGWLFTRDGGAWCPAHSGISPYPAIPNHVAGHGPVVKVS